MQKEQININWGKSKEEVWAEISRKISGEGAEIKLHKNSVPGRRWLALAASLTLLLALSGFMRFHTIETHAAEGEQLSLVLPDGSIVELNSNTSLSYHPHWWRFQRTAQLEGEAWFEVKRGSKFRVRSELACTEVLGTTFNIFARGDSYLVSCHSGKVSISSHQTKKMAILEPGSKLVMSATGSLEVSQMQFKGETPAWLNPMLTFTSIPLRLVFDEIELQYGIEIDYSAVPEHLYSGNFPVDTPPENVLSLLCRPFNLTYERTSGNNYLILPVLPE